MNVWIEESHKLTESEKYSDVLNNDVVGTLSYFLYDKLEDLGLSIYDIKTVRLSFEVDNNCN